LRILTVARIDKRKGHLFALSALQQLAAEIGQAFEWTVVGAPVDRQFNDLFLRAVRRSTFRIILKEGLSMEELADEYRKADVFLLAGDIHPKRVEGFGMVYLEAGLFGVPSVGTSVGGTAEAVIDGVTGLLSQPGDLTSLVHNLRTLLEKDGVRKQMGIAAKEHALNFTWERTAAAIFQNNPQELT
jgi:glycosyltransferase involved in cell wall biosynthesis